MTSDKWRDWLVLVQTEALQRALWNRDTRASFYVSMALQVKESCLTDHRVDMLGQVGEFLNYVDKRRTRPEWLQVAADGTSGENK